MGNLQQAMNILRQDGLYSLFKKSIIHFSWLISSHIKYLYYNIRSILFGDDIVVVNNVKLDLDSSSISTDMIKRIRKGHYEQLETQFILEYLRDDLPTFDFGSGIGYTACLIDNHVDNSVPVFGIEANKKLIPIINRNRELNSGNFTIIHSAYDSQYDTVDFQVAEDFWSSSQYDRDGKSQQKITVNASSLEQLIHEYDLTPPIQVVVDIEGGEHDLIMNELDLLASNCGIMIIEFHEFVEYDIDHYSSLLQNVGFELVDSESDVHVYRNQTFQD